MEILYIQEMVHLKFDNFLVDSNGNNVLNADNEPIVIENGFVSQIWCCKKLNTTI